MSNEYWNEWSENESAKVWIKVEEMVYAQRDTKDGTVFWVG